MRVIASLSLMLSAVVVTVGISARAEGLPASATALLPDRVASFVASGVARPSTSINGDYDEVTQATREYRSSAGERVAITVVVTKSESTAYSLLSSEVNAYQKHDKEPGQQAIFKSETVGTASYLFPGAIFFFKGPTYVAISQLGDRGKQSDPMVPLARALADSLAAGEPDIPPLVKHLPDQANSEQVARYAVNRATLALIVPNQPVLESLSFEGGTEVAAAEYGKAQLLIAEFSTPQLATMNNWNIEARIKDLRSQGQPAPTAYRRVGNYGVFVFNAPDEQTGNALIDQVKYQQVVQWLGDNPNWLRDAQRHYTETMLGTFVSVVKASGLAAVLCFGVGGIFGVLLFTRRRAQHAAQSAFSDAGGMMRLNIDELSADTHHPRLLGPGKP